MKQFIYICSFICLFLSSCYEDNSNSNIEKLNPIVIDWAGKVPSQEGLRANFLSPLKLNPLIYKIGMPDAKMSYEWRLSGNGVVSTVIGTAMSLNYVIKVPSQPAAYHLRLTVKDELTGICRYELFELYVMNNASKEGLLIADTHDEVNSDLHVVVCRCFTASLEKQPNTYREIEMNRYSTANNEEPLEGLVTTMKNVSYQTNRSLTVLTNKAIIRADYYDFIKIPSECNEGIFSLHTEEDDYTKGAFFQYYSPSQQEYMCLNGRIYTRYVQNGGRLYSFYLMPNVYSDYYVSHMYIETYYSPCAYDYNNKKIILFASKKAYYPKEQTNTTLFDVNDLSDYEPLYMGRTKDANVKLLAHQKSTNKYFLLSIKYISNGSETDANLSNMAGGKLDISEATDIASAKYFASHAYADAIYYATDKVLYSTPLGKISAEAQYSVGAGEKITAIRIWEGAGKFDQGKSVWDTKDNTILITIYNEMTKKGRVVVVPIVTRSLGSLEQDPDKHLVFGDKGEFGRILSVTPQLN